MLPPGEAISRRFAFVMTNVLAFSPYAYWQTHSNYEVAILSACRLRGAEVRAILCDGQLSECDMHCGASAGGPRPFSLCATCQAAGKAVFDETGLPYDWLGTYLTADDRREVFAWATELRPEQFAEAVFRGQPIGPWITSSVVTYWRRYPLPLDDWNTVNVYRGFLHAGAVACLAVGRLLEHIRPDALLLFNGRRSVLRVALNLAKQRGIRTLVHEAARDVKGTLAVVTDAMCTSAEPFRKFWRDWEDVPLTQLQLIDVHRFLLKRRHGAAPLDVKFTVANTGNTPLRTRLGVHNGTRLLALFNSSTDEFDGDPECPLPYPTQENWVERVVAWAGRRTDLVLAIRVHPCLAGVGWGTRAPALIDWYRNLATRLPANVRIFLPDDPQSSYELMDAADAAITYGSTAGAEFLALGKPVAVVPAFAIYEDCRGVVRLGDPASLESALDRLTTLTPSREYRRNAYRCLYRRCFHMPLPFKSVTLEGTFWSKPNYKDPAELREGFDEGLDRICRFLMEGTALFPGPNDSDRARCETDEDTFFERLEADPEAWSDDPDRMRRRLVAWARALRSAPRRTVRGVGHALLRLTGA
jgi:hypothetical protein